MFKTTKHTYKTLRPRDPGFVFMLNGISIVPRAGFEISSACPQNYREIIAECIDQGWLKPVANMRDTEYTMELLRR